MSAHLLWPNGRHWRDVDPEPVAEPVEAQNPASTAVLEPPAVAAAPPAPIPPPAPLPTTAPESPHQAAIAVPPPPPTRRAR
jgi:hypothetical protein